MGAAILCNAGTTPLMHASEQGHRPVAKWLLAQGAKPTEAAAELADSQGHREVAKMLRKALKQAAAPQ